MGLVMAILAAALYLMFVTETTLGLSPFLFMAIFNSIDESLYNAFVNMTGSILNTKLIPPNVEASIYSMKAGLVNFCFLFVASWNTLFWNKFFEVTEDNLNDLWKLIVVKLCLSFVPLGFLWLVPSREEQTKIQTVVLYMQESEKKEEERDYTRMIEIWCEVDKNVAQRMGVFVSDHMFVSLGGTQKSLYT